MKLLLLLLLSTLSFAQRINTIADLRVRKGTDDAVVVVLGNATMNDGSGDTFYWSNTSTATDDGITVIQVTGTSVGRWIRLKALNVKAGSYTTSGLTLTTSYIITHGLGIVPSQVIYTPTSLNAAVLSYVSARTATTFTITFLSIPVIGTNNLSFD